VVATSRFAVSPRLPTAHVLAIGGAGCRTRRCRRRERRGRSRFLRAVGVTTWETADLVWFVGERGPAVGAVWATSCESAIDSKRD
jgi:hypothetical protein